MNLWRDFLEREGYTATHGIIGVDPGGTTGIFSVIIFDHETKRGGVLIDKSQVTAHPVRGLHLVSPSGFIDSLLIIMKDCGIPEDRLHVAIEKYTITRRTMKLTRQHDALEVTGAVKDVARSHGAHTWEFTPAKAKRFATDELLERVDWMPARGKSQRHARDAARVAWSCLAEVNFPMWEQSWEGFCRVVDGGEIIACTLDELMINGWEDDNDVR